MLHALVAGIIVLGGFGIAPHPPAQPAPDAAPGIAIVLRPIIPEPLAPTPLPTPVPPPAAQLPPPITVTVQQPDRTAQAIVPHNVEPAATDMLRQASAPRTFTPPPPPSPTPPPPAAVSFAGLSSSGDIAKGVVYAVDCSGPMVTAMPLVAGELLRSISALTPEQRFTVVAFSDAAGKAKSRPFSTELLAPNRETLARLARWLDTLEIGGSSNPIDGLRTSLALALTPGHTPAVVFLLCRSISRTEGNSWQLSGDETLRELDTLNPINPATNKRAVAIKTIQFIEPDTSRTLEKIARQHGGDDSPESSLKVITPADIRRK